MSGVGSFTLATSASLLCSAPWHISQPTLAPLCLDRRQSATICGVASSWQPTQAWAKAPGARQKAAATSVVAAASGTRARADRMGRLLGWGAARLARPGRAGVDLNQGLPDGPGTGSGERAYFGSRALRCITARYSSISRSLAKSAVPGSALTIARTF